jgi:hypothetical protein
LLTGLSDHSSLISVLSPDSAVDPTYCRMRSQILLSYQEMGMRPSQATASLLYPKLRFAFTDHPITVWARAILLRLYIELIGLRAALLRLLGPFTNELEQSDFGRRRAAGLVVWLGLGS